MNKSEEQPHAARCGARTRGERGGRSCRGFPVRGKSRCRMHGGNSTGPPRGNENALKHGRWGAATLAARREANELVRSLRATLRNLAGPIRGEGPQPGSRPLSPRLQTNDR